MLNLNSELSTNMSDVWKVPRSRQRWCKDLTTIIFIVSNFVSELIIMYLERNHLRWSTLITGAVSHRNLCQPEVAGI